MPVFRSVRRANPAADPFWRPLRPAAGAAGLQGWLGERGSLTARLRGHCGTFSLQRMGQRFAPPLRDEAMLLGQPIGRRAWVREVMLLADGVPVVWAHSVAHPRVLRDAWRLLRRIGARPVGDAVFARAQTRRGDIRVRRLRPGHPLHRAACAAAGVDDGRALWARRSAFVHRGRALWVTEVFLPDVQFLRPRCDAGRERRRR